MAKTILEWFGSFPKRISADEVSKHWALRTRAHWLRRGVFVLVFLLTAGSTGIHATGQTVRIEIPPVKIPLNVKDQRINIVASALVTQKTTAHGMNDLKLELDADLSDLQQNMTELLSEPVDKHGHCGDRIAIQPTSTMR